MQNNLVKASYEGIEFFLTDETVNTGLKTVTHDFVNSNQRQTEVLGEKLKIITVNAFFVGENAINQRNNLSFVLSKGKEGTLSHPYYGDLPVQPTEWNISTSFNNLGEIKISLTFKEQKYQPTTLTTIVDIEESYATAQTTLDDSIKKHMLEKLKGAKPTLLDHIKAIVAKIQKAFAFIGEMKAKIEAFKAKIVSTVQNAIAMVEGIKSFIDELLDFSFVNDIIDAVEGFLDDFSDPFDGFNFTFSKDGTLSNIGDRGSTGHRMDTLLKDNNLIPTVGATNNSSGLQGTNSGNGNGLVGAGGVGGTGNVASVGSGTIGTTTTAIGEGTSLVSNILGQGIQSTVPTIYSNYHEKSLQGADIIPNSSNKSIEKHNKQIIYDYVKTSMLNAYMYLVAQKELSTTEELDHIEEVINKNSIELFIRDKPRNIIPKLIEYRGQIKKDISVINSFNALKSVTYNELDKKAGSLTKTFEQEYRVQMSVNLVLFLEYNSLENAEKVKAINPNMNWANFDNSIKLIG